MQSDTKENRVWVPMIYEVAGKHYFGDKKALKP